MPDYAATAKKYEELAARAADPELVDSYRNLEASYQLLARGTELLRRRGEPQGSRQSGEGNKARALPWNPSVGFAP